MRREDLIELANAARTQGAFSVYSQEELDALPVKQTELDIPTTPRHTRVYEFRPVSSEQNTEKELPMLINFHGGGFIKGRSDRDRIYCSHLADRTGAVIWDIDYVLAPENPFPSAVTQCFSVIQYAFEHAPELHVNPEKILLLGHSAGGNLAAAACIQAAETGAFRPAGMILEYMPVNQMINPFCKLLPEHYQDKRRIARAETEKQYLDFYCKPDEALSPLASPILASEEILATFPECLIISAGEDSLRDECEAFAHKLAASGVTVTLRRFRNSPHGFTINRMGEFEPALALHETFILNHI